MTLVIINLLGILLIGLVIWWFWFSEPDAKTVDSKNVVEILVKNGVYQPALIQALVNQPLTLRFLRHDPTPCAEVVLFPALNVSAQLPLQKPVTLSLTFSQAGEYEFTCQMGMYRGKVVVG